MTFEERIEKANEEIRRESESFLEDYDAHLRAFMNMLEKTIKDARKSNRRKNRRNRILNIAKQTFPTK